MNNYFRMLGLSVGVFFISCDDDTIKIENQMFKSKEVPTQEYINALEEVVKSYYAQLPELDPKLEIPKDELPHYTEAVVGETICSSEPFKVSGFTFVRSVVKNKGNCYNVRVHSLQSSTKDNDFVGPCMGAVEAYFNCLTSPDMHF